MASPSRQKKKHIHQAGDSSRDLLIPRSLEVTYIAIEFGSLNLQNHPKKVTGLDGWITRHLTFGCQRDQSKKSSKGRPMWSDKITSKSSQNTQVMLPWYTPNRKIKSRGFSVKELEGYIPENSQGTQKLDKIGGLFLLLIQEGIFRFQP